MNKKMIVCVALLAAGLAGCSKAIQPDGQVAARVNGKNILRSEIEKYYNFKMQDSQEKPVGDAEKIAKMDVLRELIEREIMSQKADQLKLQVKDADIDAQMKQLQGEAKPEEFRRDLERRGFTEQDMRNEIRRSMTVEMLVQDQISSKVQITDVEVRKFFDDNRETFNIHETQYHIGQIAVTSNPSAPIANMKNDKALNQEQAAAKMQHILTLLKGGQEFQQVAQELSEDPQTARQGGDLGFQTAATLERMGPQVKQAIMKMNPGDVTPVIQMGEGFLIVKLFGKRDPGQKTLKDPEVDTSIRAELRSRKQQLLSSAFSEQMRNEAHVENLMAQEVISGFKK